MLNPEPGIRPSDTAMRFTSEDRGYVMPQSGDSRCVWYARRRCAAFRRYPPLAVPDHDKIPHFSEILMLFTALLRTQPARRPVETGLGT